MTEPTTATTPIEPPLVTRRTACRICGGTLDPVLSLGPLALPRFRLPPDPPAPTAPLDLVQCRTCRLVQLQHTVMPDALFREYWYRSSVNEQMVRELDDVARDAVARVTLNTADDVLLDVGANDGTLLGRFRALAPDVLRIAVEPAANLYDVARGQADVYLADYFPLRRPLGFEGQVKILTSIACVYDADDPVAFVTAVDRLLHKDGVWIVQFQDLAQMTQATAFDNVCHEHLTYYSLRSFQQLLLRSEAHLHVTHAERRLINGGSLRLVVERLPKPTDRTISDLTQAEAGSDDWQALERFAWRVGEARRQITAVVDQLLSDGQPLDAYGASTKFSTLAQYCGLGSEAIRQVWERSPAKIGRLTTTDIPIVSEEVGRADPPGALLVGVWQFRDAVVRREAAYLATGRPLVFPLPVVDIVRQTPTPIETEAP